MYIGITVWIATKNTPEDLVAKARYLLGTYICIQIYLDT
jgi:hypothetical protein